MCESGIHGMLHKMQETHMVALSWILFESQAVLKFSKHGRVDIGSDSLKTADFICISIRLAHFAIFPKVGHYTELLEQTRNSVVEGFCEVSTHRLEQS